MHFSTAPRWLKIAGIIATLFLLFAGFVAYKVLWDPENTKQVFYPISDEEKGLLRHGDMLLRQGYGSFSEFIVDAQDEAFPVSHCAMLINNQGKWQVVHALSSSVAELDGVQIQSLQRFLNETVPNTLVVSRFKSSPDSIAMLANRVLWYAREKKPFDHQFDNADTSAFYCTELFRHCFECQFKRTIFSLEKPSDYIPLSTFQDTTQFEIIINHHLRKAPN